MIGKSLHTAWAELFLSSLRRAGVTDVVVSPGSRSTPLALAAAADPHLRVQVILDERVAAFLRWDKRGRADARAFLSAHQEPRRPTICPR